MCKRTDRGRPFLDHVIGESGGPWGSTTSVAGYYAIEFSEGGGGGEFAC